LIHIVLVHPEIPPNTGNVIRLAANAGAQLHLVEPLGFDMDDKQLRRAGLDYHEFASVVLHAHWDALLQAHPEVQTLGYALTTKGSCDAFSVSYPQSPWLIFGSETAGLPEAIRSQFPASQRIRLPMQAQQRSLNLSNAVAITVYEVWRQQGFGGAHWPATPTGQAG
jgi:tRNA (cytidine/uridine-2'-O-)-methyltransferase